MISPVSGQRCCGHHAADQEVFGHADVRGAGLLQLAGVAGGDALVLGHDDLARLVGDVEACHFAAQALGHKLHCAPLSIRRKLSLTKKFARMDSGSGQWP
jgi:hypothetical protein